MAIDKTSNDPLYTQIKDLILKDIVSGKYKPGSFIPTEDELCRELGISKYPVRQALGELVKEGYLERTRGKGTNVSKSANSSMSNESGLLGLILTEFSSNLCNQIMAGFEKQARSRGFLTIACSSSNNPDDELKCFDMLIEKKCSGLFIFLSDESRLLQKIQAIREKGLYVGLLDRNPGINDIDYVGSDNQTGAYMAARHLAHQGYRNVAFLGSISDLSVSSVMERFEGFKKGADEYGLKIVTRIDVDEDIARYHLYSQRFLVEKINDEFNDLKDAAPIGVFASKDVTALYCMKILDDKGITIGSDAGIIGFDNIIESGYAKIPLTTVAQNGVLIGQTAADCAIDRIQGKRMSVFRALIPTQLVIRKSCGEGK